MKTGKNSLTEYRNELFGIAKRNFQRKSILMI